MIVTRVVVFPNIAKRLSVESTTAAMYAALDSSQQLVSCGLLVCMHGARCVFLVLCEQQAGTDIQLTQVEPIPNRRMSVDPVRTK